MTCDIVTGACHVFQRLGTASWGGPKILKICQEGGKLILYRLQLEKQRFWVTKKFYFITLNFFLFNVKTY